MAHIKLANVTKHFGSHAALDNLSLEIADGEFFILLGPTGAGKTTTLRLIAGLERPDAGTIEIDGQDVRQWSAAERDVALVFQYYSLYPRYTVRQNLAFPLKSRIRNYSPAEITDRIARAAKTLRIEHLLERKTDRLSGGEMQRVSIGRAIVRDPRAFLMDEPLSNLDAKLREALRAELKELQLKLGATFLFVTHDQIEAMSMGDRVGVLNQGRIIQVGTPHEIYNRPRDLFVASFVGSPAMNLMPGEVRDGRLMALAGRIELSAGGSLRERLPCGPGPVTLGIRCEDIRIGPGEVAEARVHDVENLGVEKIVTLRVDEQLLRATTPAALEFPIDSAVRFGWNPHKLHCFDVVSGANLSLA
ncbi:MAG TPA: ABC transporter ATP-binding protein [Candidatus Acidoferrum sp.]|nr:ABC transporter ATP-binding protein [Candidatus Acidoferrum sp.]